MEMDWLIILIIEIKLCEAGISDVSGNLFIVTFPPAQTNDRSVELITYTHLNDKVKVAMYYNTYKESFKMFDNVILERGSFNNVQISLDRIQPSIKANGTGNFYLTVLSKVEYIHHKDSFQALPVEGWGRKYVAFIVRFLSSVDVVTSEKNKVTVDSRNSENIMFTVTYRGVSNFSLSNITFELNELEGFTFQNCSCTEIEIELLAVEITGENVIGVIISSCAGYLSPKVNKNNGTFINMTSSKDYLTEMLLPVETFGREFILFSVHWSNGYFLVVTAEEFATVRVVYKTETSYDIENWQQLKLNASSHSSYIHSNKPVQVTFVLDNACLQSSQSKPSFISLVIPRELFLEAYYWYTFDQYGMIHFLMYVCRSDDSRDLMLDKKFIYKMSGLQYNSVSYGQHMWFKGEMRVYPGQHTFHGRNGSKFGLYLYGVESGTYMHPAGFISSPINTNCEISTKIPGDMLDNDCDGTVDEERNDYLDNDNDGSIDEDLMPLPTKHGEWSHWKEWYCVYCANDTITRHRLCNHPKPSGKGSTCEGENTQQNLGSCSDICEKEAATVITTTSGPNKGDGQWGEWTLWDCNKNCKEKYPLRTRECNKPSPSPGGDNCTGSSFQYGDKLCQRPCTMECPSKFWGSNCSRTCKHCKDECSKETGICSLCESGFQSPQLHCSVECEKFTYGPNCEGNCFKKCDSLDCIDRVLGICPPEQRRFLWLLLLLLLPIPIGTFFFLQVCHEKKDQSLQVEMIQKKVAEIARIQSTKSLENDQNSLTSLAKMAGIYYFPPEDTEV